MNYLGERFPGIGNALETVGLMLAPTSLSSHAITHAGRQRLVYVKHDESSGRLYGGNKVRKLDYLLARARQRGARAVATFGAVGSHHALATALYAEALGFEPICFLGHQPSIDHVRDALGAHVAIGTRIVRYGGDRAKRVRTLRQHLHRDKTWVIPAGGSSWLGAVGFVDAGLELANQLAESGEAPPARIYVANGTMGTAAGLALGLALGDVDTEVHAVRVTDEAFASRERTFRLMVRIATLLNGIDDRFPADLPRRARIRHRGAFVGDGYTRPTTASEAAIDAARDALGLTLETTYTAKASAALFADTASRAAGDAPLMFWNTYNARPLPTHESLTLEDTGLPADFARYFDSPDTDSPPASS